MRFVLLGLGLFLLSCSSQDNPGIKDFNGTWRTESAVSYFIEYDSGKPGGQPVELGGVELVERFARKKWELKQRSDGLITGMNYWVAYDEIGDFNYDGQAPLVGAVTGERLVVMEAANKEDQVRQVLFDCIADGHDRLKCIGYNLGGNRPFVIRFNMIRER